MYRNVSPPLLKTLYSFRRSAQKLCQLFLSFSQTVSNPGKFSFVHSLSSVPLPRVSSYLYALNYTTKWYIVNRYFALKMRL